MKLVLVLCLALSAVLISSVSHAEHEEFLLRCTGNFLDQTKTTQPFTLSGAFMVPTKKVLGVFKHLHYRFASIVKEDNFPQNPGLRLATEKMKNKNGSEFNISDPKTGMQFTVTLPDGELSKQLSEGNSSVPFDGASITFQELYGTTDPVINGAFGSPIACAGTMTNDPNAVESFLPGKDNDGTGEKTIGAILGILLSNLGAFNNN